jgi:hypothetical protein
MCGIHGSVLGKERNNNAGDFLKDAFVANCLRGENATGLAVIDTDTLAIAMQKLPVPGIVFKDNAYAHELMREACGKNTIAIGHDRATTSGGNGYDQAHPFIIDCDSAYSDIQTSRQLIGVHNGTLTGWAGKLNSAKFAVDSEWALHMIYNKGVEAFKEFFGAYCFVWWDSDTPTILNFALNKERNMYVGFDSGKGMYYASEAGMLNWLMERNNLKLDGSIIKLKADHWYKFDVNNIKAYTKEELPKYTAQASTVVSYSHKYMSTMEKLEAIFGKVKEEEKPKPIDTTYKVLPPPKDKPPLVTQDELALAKERNVIGRKAVFMGQEYNKEEDIVYGLVYGEEKDGKTYEYDGMIRNAGTLKVVTAMDDVLANVSIIGVIDDGSGIVVVCTHPKSYEEFEPADKTSTIH